ncbi:hypothetical protein BGZ80_004357 [Entomortierella chlamydospora]|uniref:DUF937 domain-containing protein n=1 Tax=Entomortierella chlamydospora TaxID=101097 RepID=A0A9P6T2H3_9FUNG|nr:hypothetical protein BGZ80_004357 [Entomortierella chlamydospora]
MEALTPILMNFLEEHARPHVKEKVSEELDETKVDLKENLPDSVMEHLKSQDANPMISQVADSMGDKLMEHIRKITNLTVETASEGMDLLLTDGVMNIARGILTEDSDGKGFNLDFLNKGKEGMVETTMIASKPVIKQVSTNISHKVSTHVPSHIGRAVQEFIDEHGGPNGPMAMVAGLFAKFTTSLEGELRGKVFSVEYIEKTALTMITGVSSGLSGEGGHGIGGLIGGLIQKKLGGDSDDDEDGKKSQGGKGDDPMALIGSLATQFFQSREN